MTSSNENTFRFTGPLWGNPPVTGGFPSQRPVTRSFDVFFDLRLFKRLSEQSRRWWFYTPLRSLWRTSLQWFTWTKINLHYPYHFHAVSANRILWVYAGFWWYHGILMVHLQDSVGAFGAKWLTKWLHHAKAPPHRGVLRWEWGCKDVHLVTTFVFCHVSKCNFLSRSFIVKTCPQNAEVWYRSRLLNWISRSYLCNALKEFIITFREQDDRDV